MNYSLGEVQYDTGIPKYVFAPANMSLGEVQYDTGIPKYVFAPANMSLGQSSFFSGGIQSATQVTTSKGTTTQVNAGPSAFQQIGGALGNLGQLGLGFFQSYNQKSLGKTQIKVDERLQTHALNLSHLSEKDQIAAQIEIAKIQAGLAQVSGLHSGKFGVENTKIVAIGGVASVALIGLFVFLTKRGKK